MKPKRVFIAVLVLITAVIAVIHLNTRKQVPEGVLRISSAGERKGVSLSG